MTPALVPFFEHLRTANPFRSNRVVTAFGDYDDVVAIHKANFEEVVDLVTSAKAQAEGVGIVVWGEPGIGKSHLLDRLSRWSRRDFQKAILVYLPNLQASPESLSRTLVRTVISILTDGRHDAFRGTTLFRLVGAAVRYAVERQQGDRFTGVATWEEARTAFDRLFQSVGRQNPSRLALIASVYPVLFRFFEAVYRGEFKGVQSARYAEVAEQVVRWLSADDLETSEAQALKIATNNAHEGLVSLVDDQQVKAVLATLAQLAAWWNRPLILCFDQVDTLEKDQVSTLTKFLHGLLDAASNVAVLTVGVQEELLRWSRERVIAQASWERLAQHPIQLKKISPTEASQIVASRVQRFQQPFLAVPAIAEVVRRDPLFPLGQAWLEQRLRQAIEVRPRDVINWARDGWRNELARLDELGGDEWLRTWGQIAIESPPAAPPEVAPLSEPELTRRIEAKLATKLQELEQQRLLHPQSLAPDAHNLSGLLFTLLRQPPRGTPIEVESCPRPRRGPGPAFSLKVRRKTDAGTTTTGVQCLATRTRSSLTYALRRILEEAGSVARIVLVTDERTPLSVVGRGAEHLETLRQTCGDRFVHVDLSVADYAALDALQSLIGLARSQDLEVELPGGSARRISEAEVLGSATRCEPFERHPLLRLLLAETLPEPIRPAMPAAIPPARPAVSQTQLITDFIKGKLGLTLGAHTRELAAALKAEAMPQAEESVCKSLLEQVARDLHHQGHVQATPLDEGLYLMPRSPSDAPPVESLQLR